jgi:hypothetical protein
MAKISLLAEVNMFSVAGLAAERHARHACKAPPFSISHIDPKIDRREATPLFPYIPRKNLEIVFRII